MPDTPHAPGARFFVTPDHKLIDRVRGCESRVNPGDGGETVSLSDVLGWLNKLNEERGAFENKVRELQERLDVNAASPQSIESMQRKLEDLGNRHDQACAEVTRLRQERDDLRKSYAACATEIASLAGAKRELERLRKVHAAFVAGARSLLGEKANTLEAEVDVPENLPPEIEEVANAARLASEPRASASGSEVPPQPNTQDPELPPVEDDPATGALTAAVKRQTLQDVLRILKTHVDRFSALQAKLRLDKSAMNLPRKAVFAGAAGGVFGMAMMAMRGVADELLAMQPAIPQEHEELLQRLKAVIGSVLMAQMR
jgi:hypothetical protein